MRPSGTNINSAMLMAVQLLERATREELLPSGSVSLIILLTDGDPTVGEGTVQAIQGHAAQRKQLGLHNGLLWVPTCGGGGGQGGGAEGFLRPLWL